MFLAQSHEEKKFLPTIYNISYIWEIKCIGLQAFAEV